jgi:hypothetical protein
MKISKNIKKYQKINNNFLFTKYKCKHVLLIIKFLFSIKNIYLWDP